MKLSDNDIITSARRLRAEQNRQVKLQPWPRQQHNIGRYIITAAACLASFFLGFGLKTSNDTTSKIAASSIQRDTVILPTMVHDTIYLAQTDAPQTETPTPNVKRNSRKPSESKPSREEEERESQGCSMVCDDIRYDLLASSGR
jgi:hypothetical protein